MDDFSASSCSVCCRICGEREFTFAAEMPYLRLPGTCQFLACKNCGTVIDAGLFTPDYHAGSNTHYAWADIRFYVEYAAGLDFLAAVLFSLEYIHHFNHRTDRPVYLDAGTAFGFTVAMAGQLGWEAVGVEPSEFGRYGQELLGAGIIQAYLQDAGLPPGEFGYVTLLDVLEHVPDPRAFLAELARLMTPEGVLYLTTPNAEAVTGGVEKDLVEVLSPGYHLNLLTPAALDGLLKETGFAEVQMFFEGGVTGRKQITLIAALAPGSLPQVIPWMDMQAKARLFTDLYLAGLIESKERQGANDLLYRGALYRLLARRMETGDYAGAEPYLERLARLLEATGWNAVALAQLEGSDFLTYLERAPAYAGMLFYYQGLFHLKHDRRYRQAVESFDTAVRLFKIEAGTQIYPDLGHTQLAVYYRGLARFSAGYHRQALEDFEALAAATHNLPGDLLRELYWKKGWAHLARLQLGRALESFRAASCRPPQRIRHRILCRLLAALPGDRSFKD